MRKFLTRYGMYLAAPLIGAAAAFLLVGAPRADVLSKCAVAKSEIEQASRLLLTGAEVSQRERLLEKCAAVLERRQAQP